jgi:hypothetical protein
MLRRTSVITCLVLAAAAGCVEVPDGIRAQFAGPGPQDRSNYRPGQHGAEPPPVAKAAPSQDVAAATVAPADADAAAVVTEASDGGAP